MTWLAFVFVVLSQSAQVPSRWADVELSGPPITELRVHAQAPPWLKRATVRAAREWCRQDRGLCVRVRLVRWGENVMLAPVIAEHGFAGLTSWWSDGSGPVVMVTAPELMGELTVDEVVAHELGHALCGCVGHTTDLGLMDGREYLASPTVRPSDVEMVRYFRALSLARFR